MSKQTKFNFAAGPATLPHEVHEQIISEWLDWNNMQVPLVEVGHRTEQFTNLMAENEKLLRELMIIPDNYRVLFLHGGAQMQFSLVPMNLLGKNNAADYLIYGHWAKTAFNEAQRYGNIKAFNMRSSTESYEIILPNENELNPQAAYLHLCTNETIDGMQLKNLPKTKAPIVADMSSDILSKKIDVTQYGLIYACTQKNLGVSGLAIIIVRDDLLNQAMELTPSILNYKKQAEAKSLYNTSNTFACYVTGLILQWLKNQGGVEAIEKINLRKAQKLYACIDQSHFYHNKIAPSARSIMNVTFNLANKELEEKFLQEAKGYGLLYLRGHKVSGGIRASIYNAMPEEGVDKLVGFMQQFENQN